MPTELTRRTLMFSALAAVATPGLAATEPNAIMTKSREMRRGLTNSVSDVTMTIDSGGQKLSRKMRQYVLEVSGGGNQTINVFSSPADVQGISILTHSALDGDDQQWLYLPSVGRVKRVSSSNRSGAFVGSDFAYEDLSSFEVPKYEYISAENTALDGAEAISVDYKPLYSGTGYTKLRTFLDPANYQPMLVQYFNRRGELAKSLTLSRYKPYADGAAWRAHQHDMQDHMSNSSTRIEFSDFRANGTASANFNANRFQSVQ